MFAYKTVCLTCLLWESWHIWRRSCSAFFSLVVPLARRSAVCVYPCEVMHGAVKQKQALHQPEHPQKATRGTRLSLKIWRWTTPPKMLTVSSMAISQNKRYYSCNWDAQNNNVGEDTTAGLWPNDGACQKRRPFRLALGALWCCFGWSHTPPNFCNLACGRTAGWHINNTDAPRWRNACFANLSDEVFDSLLSGTQLFVFFYSVWSYSFVNVFFLNDAGKLVVFS